MAIKNKKPVPRPKEYTLYSMTCVSNEKVYIGVCLYYVQRRHKHLYDLRLNQHANCFLQEDFNKYGEKDFAFDVISAYENKHEALRIEKYYTDVVFGLNKKYCYNILAGGDNVAAKMRRIFQTKIANDSVFRQQVSENLSKSLKGRVISEDHRKKLSASKTGKRASEETKEKYRVARKRGNNSNAKKVVNTNTGVVYDCLKDAAEDIGVRYDVARSRINKYNNQPIALRWL